MMKFLPSWLTLCSVNQRYNLKAIHNCPMDVGCAVDVVLSKSKIQSKSNSQQAGITTGLTSCCAQ